MTAARTGTAAGPAGRSSTRPEPMPLRVFSVDPGCESRCCDFAPVELSPQLLRNGLAVCVPEKLADSSMCVPALAALKKALPKYCGLFAVTPSKLLPLFGALDCIDAVVPVNDALKSWTSTEISRIRSLRAGAALVLRPYMHEVRQMRRAGFSFMAGMPFPGSRLMLDRGFPTPRHAASKYLNCHMSSYFLGIARAFGAVPAPAERLIPETLWFDRMSGEISAMTSHPKLLLLASGTSSTAAKSWDIGRFRDVANFWIDHGGIVAPISPDSPEESELLLKALPPRRVFRLPHNIGLFELMHLARFARCIVACDNGIAHLGALLGTPGVALFGPTDPTFRAPAGANWRIISPEMPCSPCRRRTCRCRGAAAHRCMNSITAAAVIEELKRFL